MRAKYVLSEVLVGLWRNVTMTIAMIITMAVSLTMLGASLLMYMQVDHMKDYYYDEIEVSIFLKTRRHRRRSARRSTAARRTTRWSSRSTYETQGAGVRASSRSMFAGRARPGQAVKPGPAARVVPGQAEGPGAVRGDRRRSTRDAGRRRRDRRPATAARQGLRHPRRDPERGAGRRRSCMASGRVAAGRQHDPGRGVQQAARSRGHEAGRRVELVHPGAVRAGGGGRRPDRRDPRLRWRWSSARWCCSTARCKPLTEAVLTPIPTATSG